MMHPHSLTVTSGRNPGLSGGSQLGGLGRHDDVSVGWHQCPIDDKNVTVVNARSEPSIDLLKTERVLSRPYGRAAAAVAKLSSNMRKLASLAPEKRRTMANAPSISFPVALTRVFK